MLKALLEKQFAEMFRSYLYDSKKNVKRSTASVVLMFVLFGALMVFIGGFFAFLALQICPVFIENGMSWFYFAVFGLLGVFIGTFGSVFNTFSGLYLAKDNDLLLSMPIPVGYIIASRLLGVYLMGLMYSAAVLIPTAIVYWIYAPLTVAGIVSPLLFMVSVSGIVMLLSCLLGYLVARISVKLKNKSFITVIVSLVFIGVYYFVYFKAQDLISDLLQNAQAYAGAVKGNAYIVYAFGLAGGNILYSVTLLAVVALLVAATCMIIAKSFTRIATAASVSSSAPKKKVTVGKVKSIGAALFGKELGRFVSSPNYMLNCGLGLLFTAAVGVYLIFRGGEISLLIDTIFDGVRVAPIALSVIVCTVSGMVDIVTPSVSLEGKGLWILQSLPVTPRMIIKSKLSVQLLLTGVPVIFSDFCGVIALRLTFAESAAVFAVTLIYVFAAAFFDMILGMRKPDFNWSSEIIPIKQSFSVFVSLFAGFLVPIAFGGLYTACYTIGAALYLWIVAAVLAVIAAVLGRYLYVSGPRIFASYQ